MKPATTVQQPRTAVCGACGSERVVTSSMRRDRNQQFKADPREAHDWFYCGCENYFDEPNFGDGDH